MTSWRVATFNIRHGLGRDGRVDLARTAGEIRALRADVVGLQEVDVAFGRRSRHEDQAARLGALLGTQARFGAALDLPPARAGRPRRRYGVALLTGHEILAQGVHPLPPLPGHDRPTGPRGTLRTRLLTEPRGVLRTRLRRRDGAELEVLVTHLDPARRAQRAEQVQGILALAAELDGPAVLMGDMNADPGAPEFAALTAAGWRDAAREAPGARGRRRGRLARATHPARLPLRRLDVLWLRGGVEAISLEVGPRGGSDHRPVVAELRTSGRTGRTARTGQTPPPDVL